MAEKAAKEEKRYSNSFHTLEAIWSVLRKHSSKQKPLTVREIHSHLKQMESAPSQATLNRLLPQEAGLIDALFPGVAAQEGELTATNAYHADGALHIVVETPEGAVLSQGKAAVEAAAQPFKTPSYSTLDKMLKEGIPFDLHTFPFRLRCVVEEKDEDGRLRFVRYEDWEARLEAGKEEKNNKTRRYYLANVLTDAEWRVFSDLVQVYPFITERQTEKFLAALNRLRPWRAERVPSRYAHKQGGREMFRVIALLDQAIREKRKVELTYGEHVLKQVNSRWRPVLSPRAHAGKLLVEPYALMWSNGNYYLVAKHRGMMNLRVDRILSAGLQDDTFTPPDNFDPVQYRNRSPVMYPGESAFVRMVCKTTMVNTLLDFFGDLPQYTAPSPDGTTEVTMSIAPSGVKLFALQYADSVEVLEPEDLRREIARTLNAAAEKYK